MVVVVAGESASSPVSEEAQVRVPPPLQAVGVVVEVTYSSSPVSRSVSEEVQVHPLPLPLQQAQVVVAVVVKCSFWEEALAKPLLLPQLAR